MATVSKVFLPDEGKSYSSNEVLSIDEAALFKLRRFLREPEGLGSILCATCFQPLILAGTPSQKHHFKHPIGSEDCPVKSTTSLTDSELQAISYNGIKESKKHKDYKATISNLLKSEVEYENIQVEQTYREQFQTGLAKTWRRPDISFYSKTHNMDIAIELVLDQVPLDVIVARDRFFKEQGATVLWLFLQDKNNFTRKDIFYNSNENLFVFDLESKITCQDKNKLFFKCFYTHYEIDDLGFQVQVVSSEQSKLVRLNDLHFNESNLIYFDVQQSETDAKNEADQMYKQRQQENADYRKRLDEKKKSRLSGNSSYASVADKYIQPRIIQPGLMSELKAKGIQIKCACGNDDLTKFRSKACFVYCNLCGSEVGYD